MRLKSIKDLNGITQTARQGLLNQAQNALQKPLLLPVRLPDEQLNQMAAALLKEDSDIDSIRFAMQDGYCNLAAHIKHRVAEFDASAPLEVSRFEINKQAQIIEFCRRGDLGTETQGLRGKIVMALTKAIISAFPGKTLMQWKLGAMDGVTSEGDSIRIDLAQAGIGDALYTTMAENVGGLAPTIRALASSGTSKLLDYVPIDGAQCTPGTLVVNVKYAGT